MRCFVWLLYITTPILVSTTVAAAKAAEKNPGPSHEASPHKATLYGAREPQNTIFDITQRTLSDTLLGLSDTIDSFFGNERYVQKGKRSRLKLTYTSFFTERQGHSNTFKIRLKLRLPRTKERLNLVVDTFKDQFQKEKINENDVEIEQNDADETKKDVTAALRLVVNADEKWDFHTDAGVKIKFPLDPFALARVRRSFFFWIWEMRLTENLFWFKSQGVGFISRVDFDHTINEKFLLRFSNSASWLKNEDFWRFNHAFSLFQKLDKDRGLAYSIGASGLSEPAIHVASYAISTSYRQKFWRDWLFFQIIPGVSFPKSNGFKNVYSIAFRLESLFGDFY